MVEGINREQTNHSRDEGTSAENTQQQALAAIGSPEQRSSFHQPAQRVPVAFQLQRNGDREEAHS